MKYKFSLSKPAVFDIADAADYYDAQTPGLGDRFREEVGEILERVEDNPWMYPSTNVFLHRKAALRVFPFCVYYKVSNDEVVVVAVHDARRSPERWQSRINN